MGDHIGNLVLHKIAVLRPVLVEEFGTEEGADIIASLPKKKKTKYENEDKNKVQDQTEEDDGNAKDVKEEFVEGNGADADGNAQDVKEEFIEGNEADAKFPLSQLF